MGIDIFVGSGLSEEDKNLVKNMLNINNNDDENKKELGTDNEYEGEDDIKEDLELGNQIVALIEKDVNDLYLRKKIEQVKIDQINAISYVFQNDNETHFKTGAGCRFYIRGHTNICKCTTRIPPARKCRCFQ